MQVCVVALGCVGQSPAVRSAGRVDGSDARPGCRWSLPDQLAAFAGLAPITHQSGSSSNSQRTVRRGNRTVKNLFSHAAMSSALSDPASRDYYQRKRAEGKRRNGALLALARRKVTVLQTMLRTRTPYRCVEPATAVT